MIRNVVLHINDPPKSPLKRGTLSKIQVPPLGRGARGDLPTVARINEIGISFVQFQLHKNPNNLAPDAINQNG